MADTETVEPIPILDLAWPRGLQPRLSEPVAVLLSEGQNTLKAANSSGYRYFTDIEAFKDYAENEVLAVQKAGKRW